LEDIHILLPESTGMMLYVKAIIEPVTQGKEAGPDTTWSLLPFAGEKSGVRDLLLFLISM
jgi:hypothetical protein